jgi:predicted permease
VLGVTMAIALAAGFAFGLVPTLQVRRFDLQSALKADGDHARLPGSDRVPLRSALVVSEFALAVMLVIGAALLIQSFWRVQRVDAGFDAHGVLKAEYQLPPDRYPGSFRTFPNFVEMHAFTHGLLATVRSMPGVKAAAVAGNHPIDPGFTNSFQIVGREAESRTFPEMSVRRVTAGYFPTMNVALVRGRLLQDSDSTVAPPVILVNDAAARRFFADQDPLGRQIRFWGTSRTIVGVVGNERIHGLVESAPPAVYTPLDQTPSIDGSGVLLVRAEGAPAALAASIRGAIRRQDPGLAIFGLEPLDETVARSVAERRFTMLVLGLLAGVSLLLAAAGIHGVLSYTVGRRTREIGIRLALGANPQRLRRLVIGEGVRLAVVGAVLGVLGALALSRLLSSLLFGVSSTDVVTFAAVPVLLCIVAAAAGYVPARRATKVDPLTAIRST